LLIINVLIFLAQQSIGESPSFSMTNVFALHDIRSFYFRPHQLITYMFLHGGWQHIIYNMFALWMFGAQLENFWGSKRFLIFYIVSGLGAAVCHLAVLYYENSQMLVLFQSGQIAPEEFYGRLNEATLGASGAVFGCLAAFGYLFPNSEMIILPIPFPIKAKWLVLGYAAIELVSGIRSSAGDNVAHWAHLGGGLVGLLLVIWWNRTNRRNFY
jgi:membrane associated rhomboid family serine protease